jgi:hypothetical protein
MPLASVHAW